MANTAIDLMYRKRRRCDKRDDIGLTYKRFDKNWFLWLVAKIEQIRPVDCFHLAYKSVCQQMQLNKRGGGG